MIYACANAQHMHIGGACAQYRSYFNITRAVWLSSRAAGVMAFPKMALFSGLGAALVMVIALGRPLVVSLVAGVLIFMATGGMNYTKMVIKYLPREIW